MLWLVAGLAVAAAALPGALRGCRRWAGWMLALALAVPLGGASHCIRFRDRPPWHASRLLGDDTRRLYVRGAAVREPEQGTMEDPFSEDAPPEVRWRFRLRVKALSADGQGWVRTAGGLTVLAELGRPDVMTGDEVEFLANVRLNRRPTNPGEEDFRKIFERMGSVGIATVASAQGVHVLRRPPWYASPRVAIGRLRSLLKDRLMWRARHPIDGVSAALVFGERGGLSPDQREFLSEAGSIHFLAISGLHVGLFAALAGTCLLFARVPVRLRLPALIVLIWLYVLFTGMQVSALRAAWMLSFVVAAPLFKRRYDPASALVGAGLLILIAEPQELFTPGFQLSFLAVWAIVYLYPELARILWPWETLVGRLQEPSERSLVDELKAYGRHYLLLSACAWLATAPLTAYHFHHYSLLTPLVNLVIWPLVLLLIAASFLLVPAALLGGLASWPLVWAAGQLSGGIEYGLRLASMLPGFVTFTSGPPVWWIGAFYAVLALWLRRGDLRGARALFLAGVLLLAAGCLWRAIHARISDRLTVTVADVGHGQCIVFRLPTGSVLLYDAGSSAPGRARGVAGILREAGARRIHVLAVSHRDYDHCSFAPFLAHRFPVDRIVIPPQPADEAGAELEDKLRELPAAHIHLMEGGRISAEGLDCTALHPDDRFVVGPTITENDRSLVLMCAFRGWKVVLTGDVRQEALKRLAAEHGDRLAADVLVLPHHGIWADGLRELTQAVRPRLAVASCRGDLDERTQQMLEELNVPVWRTAREGAIILEFGNQELVLRGFDSGRQARLPAVRPAAVTPAGGRPDTRSAGAGP